MLRAAVALCLAACLCFGFSACGGSDEEGTAAAETRTTTADTDPEAEITKVVEAFGLALGNGDYDAACELMTGPAAHKLSKQDLDAEEVSSGDVTVKLGDCGRALRTWTTVKGRDIKFITTDDVQVRGDEAQATASSPEVGPIVFDLEEVGGLWLLSSVP